MASAVPLFNGLKHVPCPKEAGGARCAVPGCLFGHRADRADDRPSNIQQIQSYDGAADQDDVSNVETASPPTKRQRTTTATSGPREGGKGQLTNSGNLPTPVDKVKAYDLYDPLSPPAVGDLPSVEPPQAVMLSSSLKERPTPPTRADESQPSTKPATPLRPSASAASTPGSTSSSAPAIPASVSEATPGSRFGKSSTPTSSSASPLVNSSPARPIASPLTTAQSVSKDKAKLPPRSSKAPRKPESLNPRLLKPAPATHGVRHKLLTLLHVELTRLNNEVSNRSIKDPQLKALVLSNQELIWMALDREQEIATQKAAIYNNVMRQDVIKYKRMQFDGWVVERRQALEKKPVQKNSDLGAPVLVNTGLTPDQEIEVLRRLVTPITDLEQYGYVPTPPTDEQIAKVKEAVDMSKGWEQCDRCAARFQVFPGRNINTGELASGGKCTHHSGRLYFPERQRGDLTQVPKKYRCCNQDVGESLGCAVAQTHVWKTSDPKRLASLWNFVETPANDRPHVKKAVAFDCEMGYSVHGMELVRLTATSWPDGAEVVDVLVQPYGEILDLNSRYSGVFPEDLARAVPWTRDWTSPPQQPGERKILQKVSSPEAARDLLFSFISPETILLGHGLENDLNAMRMVHPKIVDTILLYPHRRGLPIRTSLKVLMEIHLNRRIQIDTGEGHDSAEDARAAGDLARFKVQKEWTSMQVEGWTVLDGVLRAPGWEPPAPERSSEESVDPEEGGALLTEEFLEAGS